MNKLLFTALLLLVGCDDGPDASTSCYVQGITFARFYPASECLVPTVFGNHKLVLSSMKSFYLTY